MNQRSRLAGLLAFRIVAIVAISLTLTGCLKKKPATTDAAQSTTTADTTNQTTNTSTTTTVSDLTTLAATSFDSDLKAHYSQGLAAAKVWHADAVVSYVSVALGANLAPRKGNEVYVFGSASDLDNWFTYSISQETGKSVRAIIPKADYLGDKITPVNTNYWLMNYVQALQLAEQNGGSAFRIANPNPQITIFLSNRAPRGWLWWTVEYHSATGQSLALLINPNLGGVSDEQGNVLVPDRGAATTNTTTTTTTTTPSASTTTR